jgi:hypothetical protein
VPWQQAIEVARSWFSAPLNHRRRQWAIPQAVAEASRAYVQRVAG